jgi:hypothetical protein
MRNRNGYNLVSKIDFKGIPFPLFWNFWRKLRVSFHTHSSKTFHNTIHVPAIEVI